MCGIVGIAGNINVKEREVFKDMLVACQVRGRDATGAISIGADNSVGWAKTVGTPDKLFDLKSWDKNIDRFNSKILIGHCRAKTMGENTHQNAHPFDHEHVIGVHNGTLNHSWRRDRTSDGYKVDSDWLISQLSERGVEELIPEVQGAYTLVWWDRRNNTVNFLRNEERPLYFAWSKDKKLMFWASEPWMLHGVVGRQIELATLDSGFSTCKLAVDELWSFEVSKHDGFKATAPRKIVGKSIENFTTTGGYSNTHYRRQDSLAGRTNQGGSGVNSPFRGGTPGFLLEDLTTRVGGVRQLPRLPLREIQSPVRSKPNSSLPKEETTTEDISAASRMDCVTPSALPTASNSSTESAKTKGSRPVLSLISSLTTNRGGQSNARLQRYRSGSEEISPNIDLRKLGGVWYITDRKTGSEYSETEFDANTNRTCAWCNVGEYDLKDVHEFIDEWNFVCNECDKDVAANG